MQRSLPLPDHPCPFIESFWRLSSVSGTVLGTLGVGGAGTTKIED